MSEIKDLLLGGLFSMPSSYMDVLQCCTIHFYALEPLMTLWVVFCFFFKKQKECGDGSDR